MQLAYTFEAVDIFYIMKFDDDLLEISLYIVML